MKRRLLMLLISCVLNATCGQEGEKSVNLTLLGMQSKEAEVKLEKEPVKEDVTPVKMDVTPVNVTQVKVDVTPVKMDVTPVKMDVTPVKMDVTPVKVDVTPVKVDVTEVRGQTPTPEPLEEEMNNQENVISQLLGDYDKVRTISSGSDCVCRCIVRPIKRSDCSRMQDGDMGAPVRDVYTVETVSTGKDCKRCECLAPPSAVNPCEGEYRFKKLQEASKNDIKLATIIDLLEGSLYGMDLLKLNSVTTKLLTRVDSLEKTFTRSLAEKVKEKERMREKEKEKKSQQKKKKASDLERMGQKGGSGSTNKQKLHEEKQGAKNKTEIQKPLQDKLETKSTIKDKNGLVVKGVTFYKAEEERIKEKTQARNTKERDVELLVSDELPPTRSTVPPVTTKSHKIEVPLTPTWSTTTTTKPATSDPLQRTTAPSPPADVGRPINAAPTQLLPGMKTRLSWTESPADQPMPTKKPGLCKDTVASISEPVQHNTYGLPDGAWMRDARGHGSVIYLTDGHYGSILQEFRDIDAFKSGKPSNSYKLPYSFTGTGHVVFDGAFFYNRAFSRDIIRFDLRRRLVAAWTTLHDALLEEQAHRTHSEVEFAVDESGLWVLYPALDSEGFHQEVILLTHLRPRDLQPIQTFRTGLRRGRYGNSFLVCGVLYAVDNIQHRYANVTYAFDTHTFTHTVPLLAFTSTHQHTAQLSYCPLDKKLYAWDNGHQMMYDVIFAY